MKAGQTTLESAELADLPQWGGGILHASSHSANFSLGQFPLGQSHFVSFPLIGK